jgi:hypothetical protein
MFYVQNKELLTSVMSHCVSNRTFRSPVTSQKQPGYPLGVGVEGKAGPLPFTQTRYLHQNNRAVL